MLRSRILLSAIIGAALLTPATLVRAEEKDQQQDQAAGTDKKPTSRPVSPEAKKLIGFFPMLANTDGQEDVKQQVDQAIADAEKQGDKLPEDAKAIAKALKEFRSKQR